MSERQFQVPFADLSTSDKRNRPGTTQKFVYHDKINGIFGKPPQSRHEMIRSIAQIRAAFDVVNGFCDVEVSRRGRASDGKQQ
jgi:hypothetical protein